MKKEEKKISRRCFIEKSCKMAGTVAVGSLTPWVASCDQPAPDVEIPDPSVPEALVAMDKCPGNTRESIEMAVRSTIKACNGLSEIKPGQSVFIKVNALEFPDYCDSHLVGKISTHPDVIRTLIRMCKERDAGKIYVGDRCVFWQGEKTLEIMEAVGYLDVCKEEDAIPYAFEDGEYVDFYAPDVHPKAKYLDFVVGMPKILEKKAEGQEIDHFINANHPKNHSITVSNSQYTSNLKSYIGLCHPDNRWNLLGKSLHDDQISYKIAELALYRNAILYLNDCTENMIKGGPYNAEINGKRDGLGVVPEIISASKDICACDALAVDIMKTYAKYNGLTSDDPYVGPYVDTPTMAQPQINHAAALGLGQGIKSKITLTDLGVPNVNDIMATWNSEKGSLS